MYFVVCSIVGFVDERIFRYLQNIYIVMININWRRNVDKVTHFMYIHWTWRLDYLIKPLGNFASIERGEFEAFTNTKVCAVWIESFKKHLLAGMIRNELFFILLWLYSSVNFSSTISINLSTISVNKARAERVQKDVSVRLPSRPPCYGRVSRNSRKRLTVEKVCVKSLPVLN